MLRTNNICTNGQIELFPIGSYRQLNKVTRPFLDDILSREPSYRQSSQHTNIELIGRVAIFTEYNYLPNSSKGIRFDGHYTFYVNVDTFDYLVHRSGWYANLTSITPMDDPFITDLSEGEVSEVEFIIASKLSRAYFYEYGAIDGYGKNLIEGYPTYDTESDGTYVGKHYKQCLISSGWYIRKFTKMFLEQHPRLQEAFNKLCPNRL